MFRKMIPLAVLIVLVLGCKKKTEEGGGGGGAGDGKTDSDPNATYTLKLREDQTGDKTEESETETGTGEFSFGGKAEKEKQDKKIEYAETIIEAPAGGGKPTKLTRTYKTAQKFDKASNGMKALPFEGKTVSIEKKGGVYEFTADGKKLSFQDTAEFAREFSSDNKSKNSDLLPKNPVKVGESWNLDAAALKALSGESPFPLDAAKSKMTGKLTRAYTKDGKQWGVIALDFDLVVDSSAGGPKAKPKDGKTTGTVKINGTLDAVIDGSARDGTMTMNIKMDITGKEGGGELKIGADMVSVKTIKTVK